MQLRLVLNHKETLGTCTLPQSVDPMRKYQFNLPYFLELKPGFDYKPASIISRLNISSKEIKAGLEYRPVRDGLVNVINCHRFEGWHNSQL